MLTKSHIDNVCKIGQGAACCRYLIFTGTFLCGKFTGLASQLDQRVAEGSITARGDNCPGYPSLTTNNQLPTSNFQ